MKKLKAFTKKHPEKCIRFMKATLCFIMFLFYVGVALGIGLFLLHTFKNFKTIGDQIPILRDMYYVFAFIAPLEILMLFMVYINKSTAKITEQLAFLILGAYGFIPLEGKERFAGEDVDIKYNKTMQFLLAVLESAFLSAMFIILPLTLEELFIDFDLSFAVLHMIILVYWTIFFTGAFILYKVKWYSNWRPEATLWIWLLILFSLGLLAKYDVFLPYINDRYLRSAVPRYSELLVDWSLMQGIIASFIELKKPYDKISSFFHKMETKWKKDENETHTWLGSIEKVSSDDENRDALLNYLASIEDDAAIRSAVLSMRSPNDFLPELPIYHLKENESLRAFDFFSDAAKVLPSCELENDDIIFLRNSIAYLEAHRASLSACSSCGLLFMSDEGECLCDACQDKQNALLP